MAKTRVRVPKTAKKGEAMEIKAIIAHKMESGRRKGKDGNSIPKFIINRFACTYNGKEVFSADFQAAVSANPNISFFVRAEESGTMDFTWTDDKGGEAKASAEVTVA